MKKKILITSALPYVNNVPHLGNLVCIISADVYSRYLKLKGKDNIFVLGTDEHGTTTETKALEEGLTPKEICDKYSKIHKKIYDWFLCNPDCWGRSSSKENHEIASDIFTKLDKNGFIVEQTVEQAYCNKCEKFLSDRFVHGTCPHCGYKDARGDQCESCGKLLDPKDLELPRCAICASTPVFKKSQHLFIDLPKLEPKLKKWIKKEDSNWSDNARTMTQAWLKEGLTPRCITRDLKWGIPVPLKGFEKKVFYSWFDAPIAYISITKECTPDWESWWKDPENVELVQFMGKDNIPFHTILFPSFLIGSKEKYSLLNQISVNEYLNYESGMFSKSRHIGVFGDDAMKTGYKADVFRYYIMINRPEKTDTEFNWKDFQEKNNHELVANFGNLVNRTFTFTKKFFDSVIPESKVKTNKFIKEWHSFLPKIEAEFDKIEIKKALKLIMELSKTGNKFFQENEPWKTIKSDKQNCQDTLFILANFVKDLTILLEPFMPGIASEVKTILGIEKLEWKDLGKLSIKPKTKLKSIKPLFSKILDEEVIKLKDKFAGEKPKEESKFNLLNLKVAEILEADPHPDADKLMVLQVGLGESKRQIVAGIKEYFTKDQLVGRKITIVTNLEPAVLRGKKSEGMLLASLNKGKFAFLETKNTKPGESVFIEGSKPNKKKISYKQFQEVKFVVKNKEVLVDDKPLKSKTEVIKIDIPDGSEVR